MNNTTATKHHLAEIKRTLQLAAPVMIGMLASFSMNFVDTVMAGRLPEQEIAMAALATGGALWSAGLMLVIGILMAVQPSVAQLDGAGRYEEAGVVTRQGFWIALVLGLPFFTMLSNGGFILRWFAVDASIIPIAIEYLKALSWGAPAICLMLLLLPHHKPLPT